VSKEDEGKRHFRRVSTIVDKKLCGIRLRKNQGSANVWRGKTKKNEKKIKSKAEVKELPKGKLHPRGRKYRRKKGSPKDPLNQQLIRKGKWGGWWAWG